MLSTLFPLHSDPKIITYLMLFGLHAAVLQLKLLVCTFKVIYLDNIGISHVRFIVQRCNKTFCCVKWLSSTLLINNRNAACLITYVFSNK